jgi:phage terminase small subunit
MDNTPQEVRTVPPRVPLVFSTGKPISPQKREKSKKSRQNSTAKATKKKQEISNQFIKLGKRGATGSKLTVRQALFVRFFVEDPKLNGTAAAQKAGYSNPMQVSVILLKNPRVKEEIDRVLKVASRHLEISAEKTLSELANLAYSNVYDYIQINPDGSWSFDLQNITRNQAAAIGELICEEEVLREPIVNNGVKVFTKVRRTKFKLHDKLQALTLLTKWQRLMPKEEQEPTNVTINVLDAIINGDVGQMNVHQLTDGNVPHETYPTRNGGTGRNGNHPNTIEGTIG